MGGRDQRTGEFVHLVNQNGHRKGCGAPQVFVRLEIGNLKHLVDEAQLKLRGRENFRQIVVKFGLVFRRHHAERQLAIKFDGVERRAQLVAHPGHEGRLHRVGGFCLGDGRRG